MLPADYYSDSDRGPGFPSRSGMENFENPSLQKDQSHPQQIEIRKTISNVFHHLAMRETTPWLRGARRNLWGADCCGPGLKGATIDPKTAIPLWVESNTLKHCVASYCPLQPAPRSTIAAAFSPDGAALASTHGDHTVKIISCQTGKCLKVLTGHRRTPWVVRYHPRVPHILASGSLDHEVRLWDASSAQCIASHDFYRPIASLAFHASGDLIAVASGHKLHIWQYGQPRVGRDGGDGRMDRGDGGSIDFLPRDSPPSSSSSSSSLPPTIVLRTKRSLRAVHFHPHGAPILLTAEVNALDSSDIPPSIAASRGHVSYPPPTIHFTPSQSQNPNPNPNPNPSPGIPLATAIPFPLQGTAVASQGPPAGASLVPFSSWLWPGLAGGAGLAGGPGLLPASGWPLGPPSGGGGGGGGDGVEDHGVYIARRLNPEPYSQAPPVPPAEPLLTLEVSTHLLRGDGEEEEEEEEAGGPLNLALNPGAQGVQGPALSPNVVGGAMAWEGGSGARGPSQEEEEEEGGEAEGEEAEGRAPMVLEPQQGSGTWLGFHAPAPMEAQGVSWEEAEAEAEAEAEGGGPPVHRGRSSGSSGGGGRRRGTGWELPYSELLPSSLRAQGSGLPARHHHPNRLRASRSAGEGSGHARLLPLLGVQEPPPGSPPPPPPPPPQPLPAVPTPPAAAAMAAAAAGELPCTVKLRLWPHDVLNPAKALDPETCRLTIPHAVLCSEMGAHFSPCGRFLAACVACLPPLPSQEDAASAPGAHAPRQRHAAGGGRATSPTHHQNNLGATPGGGAHRQIIYELRVYSMEECTFGELLAARAVRAAHCLTSIQFSPSSSHILLAYGRRHNSLLRTLVADGSGIVPVYTILEVYRVSDMALVTVLPSAEDEVNVACFHPKVGGGLVYGTKEGRLRILRHDRSVSELGEGRQGIEEVVVGESFRPFNLG